MTRKPRSACPEARKYDAVHQPSCGDARWLSCDSCVARWQEAQAARVKRANLNQRKKT